MWLEIKLVISVISWICISAVMALIILWNMVLAFLLIIALGLSILGELLISYQIKHNHADKIIDPLPPNKEFGILLTITGLVDFIWTDKKPHGKREFVYHREEASYINSGDYPIHTINGNYGSIVHEGHDENINMFEAKAAEKITKDFDTENIKEVYVKQKQKETQGEQLHENKV